MNLNGKWKLYFYENGSADIADPQKLYQCNIPCIPCTVPGNVELDLSAAGFLPADLFMGTNILSAEKYECFDWWYETSFVPPAPTDGQNVILRFDGVDCAAEYFLNGKSIGTSDNMFIEHEFDVTDKLVYGSENALHVHITSPLAAVHGTGYDLDTVSYSWHNYPLSQYIRKAPHSFGWDIMPRALSAGIWRSVNLNYREKNCFRYVHFELLSIDGTCGKTAMYYQFNSDVCDMFVHHTAVVRGVCGEHSFAAETDMYSDGGRCFIDIPNLKLWSPKNYGEPNMYNVTVEVFYDSGEVLASTSFRQGFRTLELRRTDTVQKEGCFEFVINGVKITAVGSNWVPLDVYHSRDTERLQKALELADDIGCNILRCWGGNVYESDAFFDFCDEHGIMVWQDFAMACSYYPQSRIFAEKIEREVRAVAERLRNHACLVLWCGDNEIDAMVAPHNRPSVNRITREVIPHMLERVDPFRPYIASSPYVADSAREAGKDYYPEVHLWGSRDYYKSRFYTDSKAYFVSETGYHGCPSKESIEKFIAPDYVWHYINNPQWNFHSTDQKNSPDRVMLMHKQVRQLFGNVPNEICEYVIASQISQAEAKKFFIERVRAKTDTMGGIIWWNLLDGWPQMSDAVVDYYFTKKLAYNYIKRSSRPILAFVGEMASWGYPVLVADGTDKKADVNVKITDIKTQKVLFSGQCTVLPNHCARVGFVPMMYSDKGMFLIEFAVNGDRFINTYLYGSPPFDLETYKAFMKSADEAEANIS